MPISPGKEIGRQDRHAGAHAIRPRWAQQSAITCDAFANQATSGVPRRTAASEDLRARPSATQVALAAGSAALVPGASRDVCSTSAFATRDTSQRTVSVFSLVAATSLMMASVTIRNGATSASRLFRMPCRMESSQIHLTIQASIPVHLAQPSSRRLYTRPIRRHAHGLARFISQSTLDQVCSTLASLS